MKLRNKKNGWIVDFSKGNFISSKDYGLVIYIDDHRGIRYNSLAEFNEEWEDYEEPKECEYWYIEADGDILQCHKPTFINHLLDKQKQIGNYFSSREEAEKAVEKLKAWKRLKDKGFSIDGWTNDIGDNYYMPSDFVIKLNYNGDHRKSYPDDVFKDLELLFGGEE